MTTALKCPSDLFTEQRNESACHIFVLPDDEAGIFTDMRLSHELG